MSCIRDVVKSTPKTKNTSLSFCANKKVRNTKNILSFYRGPNVKKNRDVNPMAKKMIGLKVKHIAI